MWQLFLYQFNGQKTVDAKIILMSVGRMIHQIKSRNGDYYD